MPAAEVAEPISTAMKLRTLSKTHVRPRKPVGRRECQLVTFDLPYVAFFYNQKLLLYKAATAGDAAFDDTVRRLTEGLEIVLEEFHQLAGKLAKDEDGIFKVEYDDEMAGVEVLAAAADDVELADLMVEEGAAKLKELVPYNGILNFEGLHRPLLAVQVTQLRDGIVIGCAFNHAILDGSSTWHFMSSWAEICRGAQSISVPPFLDRTKARNTRVQLNLSPPGDSTSSYGSIASPVLREKIFKFSESAIDKIKTVVNANPSEGAKPFTTFQSLSTHLWRAVTRARRLKPEDVTVLAVFADCRKRVDPPMPEAYFGNLIQAIFTGTAAGLLAVNPPEFGAGLIQKAIEAHDAKAIDARNTEWESNPKIFRYEDAGMNCVAMGSSPRFKVYEVDFGWGGPECVRSGGNNRFDGMVYLYQGKSGGGSIDVEISLEAEAMGRLEKDKEFLMDG